MQQSFPKDPPPITWLLTALVVAALYLPLILGGGIINDDWGDILESINCNSFWQCYGDWFPLFSNRPLAPLPITLSTRLFTTNYTLYLLTNSAIYLTALGITAQALSYFLNHLSRQVFFLLAVAPCIAMPLIVSPINQLTATVAFLYWAISLSLILKYCRSSKRYEYFLSYIFLLFGFLTYEIILPLLILTALLPALLTPPSRIKYWLGYFAKFVAPILVVLALVIIWQKVLAPHYMEVYSRLNFNPAHTSRNLFTWVHLFLVQLPGLLTKSIGYIAFDFFSLQALVIFTFLSAIFYLTLKHYRHGREFPQNSISLNINFFIISSGCLISSSLIFVLTDESAVSWGYQARGLSSAWFALTIWLASLSQLTFNLPKVLRLILFFLLLVFTNLSILSFTIQRDQYVESWNIQLHILQDLKALMQKQGLGSEISIIADVPRYTPNTYNRELVFSQSWDLPAAITVQNGQRIRSGIVVDSRAQGEEKLRGMQGLRIEKGKAIVNDGGQVDFSNLWLYDFDPNSRQGTLTKVNGPADLQEKIILWQQN